jgi:hypothetical protein
MVLDVSVSGDAGGDQLSFIIDKGSACEYHLDVCLPRTQEMHGDARMGDGDMVGSESHQQREGQHKAWLQELDRVYAAECLPEWHRDSFLAVAAALMEDDSEWCSVNSKLNEQDARVNGGPSACEQLRAMPFAQMQQLVDDFAGWYDSTQLDEHVGHVQMPVPWPALPESAGAAGSEEPFLTLYNVLIHDPQKSTAIAELMNGFWREGLALAERRKTEMLEVEAACDEVLVQTEALSVCMGLACMHASVHTQTGKQQKNDITFHVYARAFAYAVFPL